MRKPTAGAGADNSEMFRLLVDSVVDYAIFYLSPEGIISSWNAGAERIKGYREDEIVGRHFSTFYLPEDLAADKPAEELRIATATGRYQEEGERVRKDGSTFFADVTITALFDESGTLRGFAKVTRDITERKRAEHLQQILLYELNHRVKNTLNTVQAMAQQTLAATGPTPQFLKAFGDRLTALSRTHNLLMNRTWEGAPIHDVVCQEILPHAIEENVSVMGPEVHLRPKVAIALGMVIHELSTNALKYGALSVPSGQVQITWEVDEAQTLTLRWIESNGPPVFEPRRCGFGTMLIEQSLAYELDGNTHLDFDMAGVRCFISVPLSVAPDPAE